MYLEDLDSAVGSAAKLDAQKHTGHGNTNGNEHRNEKIKSDNCKVARLVVLWV